MPASRNGRRSSRTERHRGGRGRTRRLLAIAALVLAVAAGARAHPLAPALLELREVAPGQFEVEFKISALQAPGSEPTPLLPPPCRALGAPAASMDADALVRRWRIDCGAAGVVGQRFGIAGLGVARIDGLVRVTLADGRVVQGVVRGDEPYVTIPARATPASIARTYARLGVAHLATGLDHLCFVAGLLLLARTRRLTIETLAAFVVGSSLTLALAAFDLRLPRDAIDLGIAFSVFWLAVELAREQRAQPTLLQRRPYLVGGGFGLLHGLGFASALHVIGLPSGDIPLALIAFNVGLDAALLAFVLAWLLLGAALRSVTWPPWAHQVPLYAMGTLGAFWSFQRAAALLR